jgi:AAA15 family ATPase/GTPase
MQSSSEAELDKIIESFLGFEQKLLDLRKKYTAEIRKLIPAKKVILMNKAEHDFKKELLKDFKGNGGRRGSPPPPQPFDE